MTETASNLTMTEIELHRKVKLINHLLGEEIQRALDDPDVTEVYSNHDGELRTNGSGGRKKLGYRISRDTVNNILSVLADFVGRRLGGSVTSIAATLPTGERIHGMIPPSVKGPSFSIRVPPKRIYTLDEYVEQGIMTQKQCDVIRQAIVDRKTIATVGGTSSGKTTLLNGILDEAGYKNRRQIIVQNVPELKTSADDAEFFFSDPKTIMELLEDAMRMNPDQIIVGEVRGPEDWDMLQAWNTGHEGSATTFHANNPESALLRLQGLCMAGGKKVLPGELISALHVIVWISQDPERGRVVRQIASPKSYDPATGLYQCDVLA
jgi:type IV secretion system protein VirB11